MKLVVVFLTLTCVLTLYLLKLNDGQRRTQLVYQYKTIQPLLTPHVHIDALKTY
ncbi:ORF040 [Spodoptera frugiperda granulovirus]|uniref:ORF040 n=1 Tax=Spodoptera frugiperda granulovirus TaxID=307454 RepID=A0A0C5AQ62_9BBAC|nr:ORF040 [Spodoptera frugiperda granulovirus]AJK91701.1 ORF040 [Spodoptera frugiperda granulovirus]AXS01061.1 pif-7 [Spodoptera frugiperda granulovirus]